MVMEHLMLQTIHMKKNSYPKAGPKKGLKMYNADGMALCSGLFTSAILPAPIARAGEKANPEKKRKIHNV